MEIFEFAINTLRTLNALNFESFLFLTNYTSQIECWAIAANHLIEQNINDRQKNISQIKSFFSKKLLKTSEVWFTNYLDEFFEFKLSKSMNFNNQIKPFDFPNLNNLNIQQLHKKIEVASNFFCQNFNLIPISIDFREVNYK